MENWPPSKEKGGSFHHHRLTQSHWLTQGDRERAHAYTCSPQAHRRVPHASHANSLLGCKRHCKVTLIDGYTFIHSLISQIFNKMYYVPDTVLGVGVTHEYVLSHAHILLHGHLAKTVLVTHPGSYRC